MTNHSLNTARETVRAAIQKLIPGASLASMQVEITEIVEPSDVDGVRQARHSWNGSVMALADRVVTALYGTTGEADELENFFEPDRSYADQDGYMAPELSWAFRCVSVTKTPTGERIAFGFVRAGGVGGWTPTGLGDQDWDRGWTETAEGGETA